MQTKKRRLRVYIAGPISDGGKHSVITFDTFDGSGKRIITDYAKTWAIMATRISAKLLRAGHSPFCPHWSVFALPHDDLIRKVNWEEWIEQCKSYIECADVMIRMPGESKGADAEVEAALSAGIPVYHIPAGGGLDCCIDFVETIATNHFEEDGLLGDDFCETIENLTNNDRHEKYGPAAVNFLRIAKVWSGILGIEIDPAMVGPMMTGMKLCRQGHYAQDDNLIDGAAYLKLTYDIDKGADYCYGRETGAETEGG